MTLSVAKAYRIYVEAFALGDRHDSCRVKATAEQHDSFGGRHEKPFVDCEPRFSRRLLRAEWQNIVDYRSKLLPTRAGGEGEEVVRIAFLI